MRREPFILPSSRSFLLEKSVTAQPVIQTEIQESAISLRSPPLPESHSFLLARSVTVQPVIHVGVQEFATSLPSSTTSDFGRKTFLPESRSFLLERSVTAQLDSQTEIQEFATRFSSLASPDAGKPVIRDKHKRNFLKAAGVAGVSLVAALFLPKKAEAFIMGSSPTTGVVGVKDSTNTRINPATEETLEEVLKTSDLTFDAGSLQVKVTSLPAGSTSSFSDAGNVARSGLVDVDRHVQVDVLSSALPSSASTETTLQTISFGGFKFALRLDTVGSVDYVGEASIGTATSAASWRIKKIDSTTGVVIQWAGSGVFDQVWDNRASLTYS